MLNVNIEREYAYTSKGVSTRADNGILSANQCRLSYRDDHTYRDERPDRRLEIKIGIKGAYLKDTILYVCPREQL